MDDLISRQAAIDALNGEFTITGRGYIDILYYGEPDFPNHRRERCFYASDSEWGDVFYDDVIAWMELPEPFNGEVE